MSAVASKTLRVGCPECRRQATLTFRRIFEDGESQKLQVELLCPNACEVPRNELVALVPGMRDPQSGGGADAS
ncbi:MAG TPA: hypothetical protein VGN35_02250 [Jatrophihabitantaceae bacterium]|nr:hypothetical protein [Jatrophihabitantaceae bacterium]